MWAYVKDSEILEVVNELPQSWKNISNFFALKDDLTTLRAYGWYPVQNNAKPLVSDLYEYYGAPEYYLDEQLNIVIRDLPIFKKEGVSLVDDREIRKQAFLEDLRTRRNILLAETDWTQLADIQARNSDGWKEAWANYRQALRDIPNRYSSSELASVTDSNQVSWPDRPGV